jgi:phosphoglycerate dehydrogenase-like enzyme
MSSRCTAAHYRDTASDLGPGDGRDETHATLVSTSRGGVVDEDALLDAVRAQRLHSAGLDVFEREPMGRELSTLVAEP